MYKLWPSRLFSTGCASSRVLYAQVEKLLVERVSQRGMVLATGASRMTGAKLTKKAQDTPRLRPKPSRLRVLKLDEKWTFVGHKRRKVWLWLAVERYTRRMVVWVRGTATARRLWRALPLDYHTGTWYYTDEWETYRAVL